jgi:2-polyprenylphenol 6-hydroxylase
MHLQNHICVIGNGVIGKVAALGFAQAGLSVGLLSPSSSDVSPNTGLQTTAWDARVYALNQAVRRLLSSVKVWDAMDGSRVTPVKGMVIHGDEAQHAGRLAFDAYSARVDALAWIVEDRNLNLALDMALKFAPSAFVVKGRATGLTVNDEGVRIQLENGNTMGASLIVGADGGQSWVRGQVDIGVDYRSYRQQAIVTSFACDKSHHQVAYQWFTAADGIIALLPLPGQRVSLVWSAPDALAETLLREPPARLAQRVSILSGGQLGQLHPLEPHIVKSFPLQLIRPHSITMPRVVLVGDAAHVVHPLAGHGMNLGFADVAALLRIVTEREPHRDCGDARLLGRYARARKEDILLMQTATDGLARLFATDIEPVRLIRNLGLNLIDRLPVIKRQLISHALGKLL